MWLWLLVIVIRAVFSSLDTHGEKMRAEHSGCIAKFFWLLFCSNSISEYLQRDVWRAQNAVGLRTWKGQRRWIAAATTALAVSPDIQLRVGKATQMSRRSENVHVRHNAVSDRQLVDGLTNSAAVRWSKILLAIAGSSSSSKSLDRLTAFIIRCLQHCVLGSLSCSCLQIKPRIQCTSALLLHVAQCILIITRRLYCVQRTQYSIRPKRSAICNRCFHGPTRVVDANGVSIASAIFAGLTRWQTDCTLRTGSTPTKRFRDCDYMLMV